MCNIHGNCHIRFFIIEISYIYRWPSIVTSVESGEEIIVDITEWGADELGGQRLYAWWIDPISNSVDPMTDRDKVEINWCSQSPDIMCYNPTSVDNFGLPVYIGPYDESDCSDYVDNPTTGFGDIKVSQIREQCPTIFEDSEPFGVCKSPYHICINSDTSNDALCSHFDSQIKTCISDGICPSGLTLQIWGVMVD